MQLEIVKCGSAYKNMFILEGVHVMHSAIYVSERQRICMFVFMCTEREGGGRII